MLQITALYGGILALLYSGLAFTVIRRRRIAQVNLGDGGHPPLLRAIRTHGNFAEYVPLILVLMGILELNAIAPWQLHLIGTLLLLGRILHSYGFIFTESSPPARIGGMMLTFSALILSAVGCLAIALR